MSKTFYIFSSGTLGRKENTICFDDGKQKKFIPVEEIEQIYIFGEMTFNTKLITFLSQNEILLHFFNYYGFYTGSFYPKEENISGSLILRQVEHSLDFNKRKFIANEIVEGSIHNIHRLLEKKGIQEEVEEIKNYEKEVKDTKSIEELMLLEAKVRKIYYSTFEKITKWEFGTRTIRPPENPLNALISFGNSLLYTAILKEIYQTQLHPAISYLHEPGERRFSLCLDIADIFKPLFVDKIIFNIINLGKINDEHFIKELNFCYLNEEGRKIFVKEFDNLLEETILHRSLKRKIKYKNLIRLELYKLIKHLLGDENYKSLRMWW